MSQLIKTEQLLGKSAVVVGDKYANLVLETLGKVYIKSGNNFKLLNDLFKLLDQINASTDNDTKDSAIIIEQGQSIKDIDYPGEGVFIFDTNTQILYISMQGRYIALINAKDFTSDKYVRKEGDTITGNLTINGYLNMTTFDTAPFIINSNKLVKNLNSEYLSGYSYRQFAKIAENETITGSWCFKNICTADDKWTFKDNVFLKKHVITEGSFSTPVFSSGFAGTGWMLDGTTNTLTIDNIVVRKAMMVYEMVVNQIRATNGSLWVTNASVCETASKLKFLSITDQLFDVDDPGTENSEIRDISIVQPNEYFVPIDVYVYDDAQESYVNNVVETIDGKNLSTNVDFGETTKFHKFKYLYKITDKQVLINKVKQNGIEGLLNADNVQTQYNDCISVIDIDEASVHRNSQFLAYIESPTNGYPQAVAIYTYYKYFGCKYFNTVEGVEEFVPNYWMITFKDDSRPVFEVGDILKCQKMNDKGVIKYYDAVVFKKFTTRTYLIQVAYSIFDIYTEVSYDENGNLVLEQRYNESQYKRGSEDDEGPLGQPQEGDDIVQVGSIQDKNRQGAVYITSSDDKAPFIDVIGELNRPDYSVIYKKPIYITYPHIDQNGKRRNYYVSEVPSNVFLGKFRVNSTTNAITPALESDTIDEGTNGYYVANLYGYEEESTKCLLARGLDGNGKYEYVKSTKARLGKLDGVYDYILGKNQPYGYGLYSDNVFLTGEFYLNNGKSIASFADDITLLSGKIENLDLDNLQSQIEKIAQDYLDTIDFDVTLESLGISGIFTYGIPNTDKKGLAILGDQIVFLTTKDDLENGNFTALMQGDKINAKLIDVEQLDFDRLVGKGKYYQKVVDYVTMTGTLKDVNGQDKTFTDATVVGTPTQITDSLWKPTLNNNAIVKDKYDYTLCITDFYIYDQYYYRIYYKEVITDVLITYEYTCEQLEEQPDFVSIPKNITKVEQTIPGIDFSCQYVEGTTEYDLLHINSFGQGEQIITYPDGTVMNAKIISKTANGHPKNCIEYFFQSGAITKEELLNGGDSYVVDKFMNGNEFSENYSNGLLKRINYFTKNTVIDYKQIKMEDYELSNWNEYLSTRIENYPTNPTYNDIYNIFVNMKSTLQKDPAQGAYGTSYSYILSDIRSARQGTGIIVLPSKTIYVGSGEDTLQWEDGKTTYPGHYIYDSYQAASYVQQLLQLGTTAIPTSKKTTLESYMYKPDDSGDDKIDVLFVSKCSIDQSDNKGNACSITITYLRQHDNPDESNNAISRDDIVFQLDEGGNYVESNEIVGQ